MMYTNQQRYCTDVPSNQTSVDIFKGLWKSKFPTDSDIQAGSAPNFEDKRIEWVSRKLGGLTGKKVLELGPFEGYHTWQLAREKCGEITAVEGNSINFLKCLVVKEILDFRAHYLFGDIGQFLETTSELYDLCVACGVLYHQTHPLRLIQQMARRSNNIFFWTHFFDDKIANDRSMYPHFIGEKDVEKGVDGYRCMHYYRSYRQRGEIPQLFSGGNAPYAYWLRKDDILEYMRKLEFSNIVVRGMNMGHRAGPTLSFLASRAHGKLLVPSS